ncbi:MAG: helix-turn-helix domain-containing protein [Gemmatimonas sp.]|nr:helix-turn-helix domain-containing protein [Gemmatimonas sp.]
MPAQGLVTVKAVAVRLDLTPATIYSMIDRGILPAVRIGTRALRIRERDLARILDEGTEADAPRR